MQQLTQSLRKVNKLNSDLSFHYQDANVALLLRSQHSQTTEVLQCYQVWWAHDFLEVDLMFSLKELVYFFLLEVSVHNSVYMLQVLGDCISKWMRCIHIFLAKLTICHLICILALLWEHCCYLGLISMDYRESIVFPIKVVQHEPRLLFHVKVDITLQYVSPVYDKLFLLIF